MLCGDAKGLVHRERVTQLLDAKALVMRWNTVQLLPGEFDYIDLTVNLPVNGKADGSREHHDRSSQRT